MAKKQNNNMSSNDSKGQNSSYFNSANKSKWRIVIIVFIFIIIFISSLIVLDIIFGRGGITGNVVKSISDSTLKLVCKQQSYQDTEYYTEEVPYQDVEYYTEQVPYQSTEYYTQTESGSNCDRVSGCSCIHTSWLGLGPCDSCQCTKTRSVTQYQTETRSRTVTKYRTETKSRDVTKLKDVCIKIKKWETPNYNDNWLDYPELYDKEGNKIK